MNRNKTLETILVLVMAFIVLYLFKRIPWFLFAAVIIGLTGLLIPVWAEKIHWVWMKLAEGMGFVMSRIVLFIIFFVFIVPISFLAKVFRKGNGKPKHGDTSYFKTRNFTYDKESMENVW